MTNRNKLFIPFFSAGYPQLESTDKLISLLNNAQADYIEIGLPHSDALADGETIQNSSQIALNNGMNIQLLLQQTAHALSQSDISSKLILFTYYNPVVAYGIEKTIQEFSQAGGHCVLIPDLPIEEIETLYNICQKYNIKIIFLIAPNSPQERIKQIIERSEEFVYLVAYTGVTGSNSTQEINQSLADTISYIKTLKPELPVVIGFGIDSGAKAKQAISLGADGVVVGSAIVKLLTQDNYQDKVQELSRDIVQSIK